MNSNILLRGGGAMLALLLLGACTAPPSTGAASPAAERTTLVWPKPPEHPRIRYAGTIRGHADTGATNDFATSLFNLVIGRREFQIEQPHGVTEDRQGRLYVVDSRLRGVHIFDLKKGTHRIFPDQPVEGFLTPLDVAVSDDGRIFVSDSEAGIVHVFSDLGKRYEGHFGTDQMERPTGLALTARSRDLIVCDTLGSRLAIYDPRTLKLKRIVGGKGDGRRGFNYPTAVTVGRGGRIYVTDSLNFRVQILSSDYRFVGRFGTAGDAPGHFARPKGIATDRDGNIYVVDALFDNVQIFDPEGRLLMAFGSPGSKAGELWLPTGIYIDPQDRIYVADSYNQRLQIFERVKTVPSAP